MKTYFCGDIKYIKVGKIINIIGWVNSNKIFSNMIFLEIRDHTGIIQIVCQLNTNKTLFSIARYVKKEYIVSVNGVILKSLVKKNYYFQNCNLELMPITLKIINVSKNLPFLPNEFIGISEKTRLKYRYIDLRRYEILYNLKFKHLIIKYLRGFFDHNGFIDIETPVLSNSTPDGARDYLVPSRKYYKTFYALAQSPQLFKELLMIGGINKYYQLAKCFRDEDLRFNRQPEFLQLDIEISFIRNNYLLRLIEKLFQHLFFKFLNTKIKSSFIKLSYQYSSIFYGNDKPDLRNELRLINIHPVVAKLYSCVAPKKNIYLYYLLVISNNYKRTKIKKYMQQMSKNELNFLEYSVIINNKKECIVIKSRKFFFNKFIFKLIVVNLKVNLGHVMILGWGETNIIKNFFLLICNKINKYYSKINNKHKFLWVKNFPIFKWDYIQKKWMTTHHPFTLPININEMDFINKSPGDLLSHSFDFVLNGNEIGGGSLRINKVNIQRNIFNILNIPDSKFNFFINSLKSGVPNFGGIALGVDRLIIIMLNSYSIRDVIAFPKSGSARCLLSNAPYKVEINQTETLGYHHLY